jgi:hypothetical protein
MTRPTTIIAMTMLLVLGSNASALGVVAGDCASLRAHAQLLERHPEVGTACESIVAVEGRRYLLMSAELRQVQPEQLVLRLRGATEDTVLSPGADRPIASDAGPALPADSAVGSPLRIFVPEDRLLEVFDDSSTIGRSPVPVAVQPAESTDARISNYTCCPRRRPWYPIVDLLPQTATPLPLIGLLGLGLLSVAAGLARRRYRSD